MGRAIDAYRWAMPVPGPCGDAAEPLQSRSSGPTDEKRNHMAGFSITIAGDSALNLEFAHAISPETSAMIRLAAENLTADPIEGITELVPTFCSLMVYYNPLVVRYVMGMQP